jgi:hypothetical protein
VRISCGVSLKAERVLVNIEKIGSVVFVVGCAVVLFVVSNAVDVSDDV